MGLAREVDAITVDNVAALASLSPRQGQTVVTRGYTTAGDGGGNEYRYDATSAATVDGGFVVTATTGRFLATDPVRITAKQAGARGDGATDDYTALSTLATNAPNGLQLEFTDGDYNVSDTILFTSKDSITIFGAGKIIQTGTQKESIEFQSSTNIKVKDISLQGLGTEDPWAGASTSYNGVAGVHFRACTGVEATGLTLTNHAGGGIRWSDTMKNVLVDNCVVTGMGRTTNMVATSNGADVAVGGTTLSGLSARTSDNVVVSNCILSEHAFGIFEGQGNGFVASNNVIFDIAGQHGMYIDDCNNVSVTGNVLRNITQSGIKVSSSTAGGAALYSWSITGNSVYNSDAGVDATVQDNSTSTVYSVTISGNSVNYDGTGTYPSTTLTDGISVRGIVDVNVSGNVVSGVGRYGINGDVSTGPGSSGTVTGNTVHSSGYAGILWYLQGDTYFSNNRIIDAIQHTGTAGTGRLGYVEIYHGTAAPANPVLYIDGLHMKAKAAEQTALTYCLYSQNAATVNHVKGLVNETSKNWRFINAPRYLDVEYSVTADWTTTAALNPSTPIYGRGRRQLYGEQDPASAGMTDRFRQGDICWNSTPTTAGTDLGWVCTTTGNPGTWTSFPQSSLRKQNQDTVTFSATPTFDFDADTGDNKTMTLTANVTSSTLTATRPGEYKLVLVQDGTGSRTFAFPTNVKGNPPQPNTTASETTVYRLYFDGTNFQF